jgi:hypothetical protein
MPPAPTAPPQVKGPHLHQIGCFGRFSPDWNGSGERGRESACDYEATFFSENPAGSAVLHATAMLHAGFHIICKKYLANNM